MATLLQLVGQVSNAMGLSAPSTVVGNTNQDVIQTLGLACRRLGTRSKGGASGRQ